MRFLVILTLVVLAAAYIRADENTKKLVDKEVVEKPANPKVQRCTEACALKTLFVDDDNLLKDFLKIFVDDEYEDEIDKVFGVCDEGSDLSDDSCEDYLKCIENELTTRNITSPFKNFAKLAI